MIILKQPLATTVGNFILSTIQYPQQEKEEALKPLCGLIEKGLPCIMHDEDLDGDQHMASSSEADLAQPNNLANVTSTMTNIVSAELTEIISTAKSSSKWTELVSDQLEDISEVIDTTMSVLGQLVGDGTQEEEEEEEEETQKNVEMLQTPKATTTAATNPSANNKGNVYGEPGPWNSGDVLKNLSEMVKKEDVDQEHPTRWNLNRAQLMKLLDCHQWMRKNATELTVLMDLVSNLTGKQTLQMGIPSQMIPLWINMVGEAAMSMLQQGEQMKDQDVLLSTSIIADAVIGPLTEKLKDKDNPLKPEEMISLLNLSITKSRYNVSRLATLAKDGKTADDYVRDELEKMDKDFMGDFDLEMVVEGLKSVHLTMKKPMLWVCCKQPPTSHEWKS